ncbi:Orn/DAP/Arg decarboxylase 2 C-terminal [Trinorchestia longiramus]|nr:Orn/DAP/Arg decarboxylase 2 C-terminal [Trinorchestia longiramus]
MENSSEIRNLFNSSIESESSTLDAIKSITALTNREQRSFYHVDIDEVVQRLKQWHLKLPRVHPHYAVKCNDNPAVLSTLALLGAGFDCASRLEIKKIISLGVTASRIIYAHPCKITSHLKYARSQGVSLMTFDSLDELNKISKVYPEAELVLRIRCDALNAQCALGIKFGAQPFEARALLQRASQLNLKVVGVSFHVGSGCSEPEVFGRAIAASKQVFVEAAEEGHSLHLLDIGGGFLGSKQSSLDEAANCINQALELHFPEEMGVRVIAEPGRYMVSAAFTLVTPIINRREVLLDPASALSETCTSSDGPVKSIMYFIDDGLYGSFNCVIYDHCVVTPVPLKVQAGQDCHSSVWGPTCDGFDRVLESIELPSSLAVGDWLVWEDMGAYTLAAAGNFNGFPLPEVMVHMKPCTRMLLESHYEKLVSRLPDSDPSSGVSSDDDCTSRSSAAPFVVFQDDYLSKQESLQLAYQLMDSMSLDKKRRTELVNLLFDDDRDARRSSPPPKSRTKISVNNSLDESESEEDKEM